MSLLDDFAAGVANHGFVLLASGTRAPRRGPEQVSVPGTMREARKTATSETAARCQTVCELMGRAFVGEAWRQSSS
jgi:hypothetical protein